MSAGITRTARRHVREKLALLVEVWSRESAQEEWTEIGKTVEISPLGLSLRIKRKVELGQLLRLSLPMPRHLRCFDKHTPMYFVWSVVRYVSDQSRARDYTVGVAFVGKRPPQSFNEDPTIRYEILPALNGLWHLCEMPKRKSLSPDKVRRFPRVHLAVGVTLETLDGEGRVTAREKTMTETVSRRGAGVLTSLKVEPGQRVRLTSAPQMSFVAVVRARRIGTDGRTRLSLAFVDKEWKIDGIK
jgi:hypothetical protein